MYKTIIKFFNKSLCPLPRYKGFTLAEILIVIGIIGIVAEMTIPSLINNANSTQYKSGMKKAFSVASSAIIQINEDTGLSAYYSCNSHGCGMTDDNIIIFKTDFMSHLKILNNCGGDSTEEGCFAYSSSNYYKSLSKNKISPAYDVPGVIYDYQFLTSDGMLWAFSHILWAIRDSSGHWWYSLPIAVDVNGLSKPNVLGKDYFIFEFELNTNSIRPAFSRGSASDISTYCNKNSSNIQQGLTCSNYVIRGTDY